MQFFTFICKSMSTQQTCVCVCKTTFVSQFNALALFSINLSSIERGETRKLNHLSMTAKQNVHTNDEHNKVDLEREKKKKHFYILIWGAGAREQERKEVNKFIGFHQCVLQSRLAMQTCNIRGNLYI